MTPSRRTARRLTFLTLTLVLAASYPGSAMAHAELERSTPADGSTVEAPFDGPIRLEYSEELADGSRAQLQDDGGGEIATATVDGPGATMEIELVTPLGPGDYQIAWTGIAVDGHVERGTVAFTVEAPPPTPEPTPSPSPTPEPSESLAPSTPSPEPTPAASPSPSPTPPSAAASSDVVIPIIVALLVVALGAAYLLSRRGRTTP
jgi:methionine-rich copper-binding protein CopC